MPGPLKMPRVVLRYLYCVYHQWSPATHSQPHLKISKIIPVITFVYCPTFICTLKVFNGRGCLLRMAVEICFYNIHILPFLWQYPGFILRSHCPQLTRPVVLMGMTTTPGIGMVDIWPRSGESGHLIHKEALVGWEPADISFWTSAGPLIKEKDSVY